MLIPEHEEPIQEAAPPTPSGLQDVHRMFSVFSTHFLSHNHIRDLGIESFLMQQLMEPIVPRFHRHFGHQASYMLSKSSFHQFFSNY